MRKADVVVAVLIVLAVVATAVGAFTGDRWTEERTVRFMSDPPRPLPLQGPEDVGGGGHAFNWTLPANATAADFVVRLSFTGQAIRGGSATVTLRVTGPDGTSFPPVTKGWAIAQGATSGQFELNTTAMWRETPTPLRDTSSSTHGVTWTEPVVLEVIVVAPADLPLATYSFTGTAEGSAATYEAEGAETLRS